MCSKKFSCQRYSCELNTQCDFCQILLSVNVKSVCRVTDFAGDSTDKHTFAYMQTQKLIALHHCYSCLHLHFYRIRPNWTVRGGKQSCCPEWTILILWHSGRHSKVTANLTTPYLFTCCFALLWQSFGFNVCKCGHVYSAGGLLCIVMEYCSGGDLLQRILQQKPTQFCTDDVGSLLHCFSVFSLFSFTNLYVFPLQILQWFAQMCAATQHIHNKRVLHRDLKSKVVFYTDMT